MALDFRELKSRMKPEFHKNYGKYYPVESLTSIGFSRNICSKCGRGFWSQSERDFCDEPACSGGYRFIGEKLARKEFSYKQAWDEYVKVFKQWDYVPIKRYPVVCRWYDELYFVNAGVNDFQPYVVSGEVPPPADAVLEPQFCLRFSDIDSVGITGRHYTGFIMAGQHTFNTPEKHVYFKDEGILQMHEFLTKGLGIKPAEIFYHEDVWAGGGNFGPSMEFFSRGLELGNQVYMQYEVLPDGSHMELKTKVIDMGAGLERWSWFSQGVPMSYDTVFPKVMEYLYKETAVKPDKKIWNKFARYASLLAFDEIENAGVVWQDVAKEVGVDLETLKWEVYRMRALYAIGDHTRTLLVAIHDGALPSNVGGGYNLRNILRRCWTLMDEFDFTFDLNKVFEIHIKEFGKWYTELSEVGSLWDIIETEKGRFTDGKKKARAVVSRMVGGGETFTAGKLAELYDSQGIHPQTIKEVKPEVTIPDDFYLQVEKRQERSKSDVARAESILSSCPSDTETLFYDDMTATEFKAKVLCVEKDFVVLDKTLFYPEGGGQQADLGTLNGVEVEDVVKEGKTILHKVSDPSKFKEGDSVEGVVDNERRLQLTQHHTATHIINAAANKVLGPHIWQAGAHKSVDMARLDVTHYKAVSDGELREIEQEANRIVAAALPVKKLVLPREEAEKRYGFRIYQGGAVPGLELRIIDIAGVDAEACGGTHLDNTTEIEDIIITGATRIQDGVVRLEFKAGNAAKIERRNRVVHTYDTIDSLKPMIEWQKQMEPMIQMRKQLEASLKPMIQMREQMEASLKPMIEWQKQMEPMIQMRKQLEASLKPMIQMREQMEASLKPMIEWQKQMERLSSSLSVTNEKLPETIKRFVDEINRMERSILTLGDAHILTNKIVKDNFDSIEIFGNHIFERWKEDRKILEKLQSEKGIDLEGILKNKFEKSSTVKYMTQNLDIKTLMKMASEAIEKEGRLLVLLNITGEKCNLIVASSNPKIDAGELAGKLSKKLGGGGRGDAKLGVGGGKAEGAEEILEELEI